MPPRGEGDNRVQTPFGWRSGSRLYPPQATQIRAEHACKKLWGVCRRADQERPLSFSRGSIPANSFKFALLPIEPRDRPAPWLAAFSARRLGVEGRFQKFLTPSP